MKTKSKLKMVKVKSNIRFGRFANDRAALNRKLYLLCSNLAGDNKKDGEAVRTIRDSFTIREFGRTYEDLSVGELQKAIDKLAPPKVQYASKSQIRAFSYQAISVALIYHNFDNLSYVNTENGEILEGKNLREYCTELFNRDISIPKNILSELYNNYINPHANTYLVEGQFKKNVITPSVMYYDRLPKDQVQYLINRFSKIFNQVSKYEIPKIYTN